ncbi:MAG: SH3 domain-containing protein [Synechococcales bacterium]|nr:SH3 domain-containing protein [Synechococcales bacterium]
MATLFNIALVSTLALGWIPPLAQAGGDLPAAALPKGFEPSTAAACDYQDFYQTTRTINLKTKEGRSQTVRSGAMLLVLGEAAPSGNPKQVRGVRAVAAGGVEGVLNWQEVDSALKPLKFGKNHKIMRVKTIDLNGLVNVRNAPEGAVIGSLKNGETVTVKGVGPRMRSYYYVESAKGLRGVVVAPYLVCT